ncbi:MAG: ligase-associated DNA damage response endonuclease PdeM [Pseudomonadota bacterium]
MNAFPFSFCGQAFEARASGALWAVEAQMLVVGDLHLGKPERVARRGGQMLPPYGDEATLDKLAAEIDATQAKTVLSLGDGFDDNRAAENLSPETLERLMSLLSVADWIWVGGNHDPGPPPFAGQKVSVFDHDGIAFRHIAQPNASGEISAHYHPKATLALGGTRVSRPCFLIDQRRIILPAFGAFTGGLSCREQVLSELMGPEALAVLTGKSARAVPMPRGQLKEALSPAPPRRFG